MMLSQHYVTDSSRMRIWKRLNICIVLPAVFISAFSRNRESNDSIDRYNVELKETIVNGARQFATLTSSSPIYNITQSQLLKSGVTDIADAIHRLPGINLRDYGGAGGLKTVSVRGLGVSHTNVVYDGLPLSDVQSGAIDMSKYSMDNIGSLSINIGDNDNLFIPVKTAAAPASIIINTPCHYNHAANELTAKLKVGSFGYISPYLSATYRLSKPLSININGEFTHSDNNYPFKWYNGVIVTEEHRENNRVNNSRIEGNIFFDRTDKFSLNGKIYYYNSNRQLPGPVRYYNINSSSENIKERTAFSQLTYTHIFNKQWKAMAAAKFNWSATNYYTGLKTSLNGSDTEDYFQREYYTSINILYTPNPIWSIDYAADYIFNSLNSNLITDTRPYRHSFLQSLSVKMRFNRIILTARLIESVYLNGKKKGLAAIPADQNRLSPSLGINIGIIKENVLSLRCSYKNIFRMPTFNEAFFNHYGSPDLKPESTEQFNSGLTSQLPLPSTLPRIHLTIDYYHNSVHNKIVAIPYNMFIWNITNVSRSIIDGIDLTFTADYSFNSRNTVSAAGSWSYQRARINVGKDNPAYGKQIAYTPMNSGSFSLGYENPWVNVVLHGQGVSARYTNNINTPESRISGYFEIGTTLWRELTIKSCNIELRFDILNLLNKQYSVIARYPMPGRALMASVKFKL